MYNYCMQQTTKLKEIETFHSPTYGILTLPQVIEKITKFAHTSPHSQYRIIIGTDSQQHADRGIDFVTALVIHRVGGVAFIFGKGITKNGHTLFEKKFTRRP